MEIQLKKFQDNYIFSPEMYPAMISAWGTGKTMCGIQRAMMYSEMIPDNLGVIFRKVYRDLADSTIKDFETYTGLKVDSKREVCLSNGSTILFRHIEELGRTIQNMNLGWFFIEQAEELETDQEFFTLWGRLRRKVEPEPEFIALGLPYRSGFIIGNVAGENWIYEHWKKNQEKEFALFEATTLDNMDVLPETFIRSLDLLKKKKPTIYQRFVMNDWTVEAEGRAFGTFTPCVAGMLESPKNGKDYIIGVDLAKSQDYTVLVTICKQTKHVVNFQRFNEVSWSLQKLRIIETAKTYHNALVEIDATGVGDAIVEDLQHAGVACNPMKFNNSNKQEMIEKLIVALEQRHITFPRIDVLIDELKDYRIEVTKAGNIRYNAPEGRHDDCVIALALAVRGLGRYVYSGGKEERQRQPNYSYGRPKVVRA